MIPDDVFSGLTPVNQQSQQQTQVQGEGNEDIFSGLQPIENQTQEPSSFMDQVEQGFTDTRNQVGRLGLMAAKGALLARAPVFINELSGQLYGSTPVQAQQARDIAWKGATFLERKQAKGMLSPEEEQQLKEYNEFANISNEQFATFQKQALEQAPEFTKTIAEEPTPMGLVKAIGKEFGIDISAKNTLEKFTEFTSMLASGRPDQAIANSWKFAKPTLEKMSPQMANLTNKVMKSAAVVAPAAALEEISGVPMEYSLLGLGAAQAGYQAAKMGLSWAGKNWFKFDPTNLPYYNPYKFKEAVQQELARAPQYVEESLVKGMLKAKDLETLKPLIEKANELGIPVSPNILVNSKYFREVQKLLRDTEMTQSEMIQFKQKMAQDWADLTKKSLKEVETNLEFSTPGSTAEALMSDVTKVQHTKLKEDYTKLFEESSQDLSKSKNISPESYERIEQSINHVIDKVGESIFETSAQAEAKAVGQKAKERLTISSKEAGRPELAEVKYATGKELKALEEQQAGRHLQERKGYWAKERSKALTKSAKERAQQTKAESQKDLESLFGSEAKFMRIDENGHIRFLKGINGQKLVNSIRSLGDIIDWDNPKIVNLYSSTRNEFKDILKKEYGTSHPQALQKLEQANSKFAQTQHLFGKQSKWKKWGIDSESTSEELLSTINSVDKFKQFERDFGGTAKGKEYIQHLKYLKARNILEPIFDMRDFTPGNVANAIHKLKRNDYFRHLVPQKTWSNLEQIGKLDALIEQRSKAFFSGPVEKQDLNAFTGFVNWAKKYSIHLLDTTSKNRRASVYANYFLDPKYTNTAKELLTKISNEMGKPKPDIKKLNKFRAYYDMNMNNLIQYSKIKLISEEAEKD